MSYRGNIPFAGNIPLSGNIPLGYHGYGMAPTGGGYTPIYRFWGPAILPSEIQAVLDEVPGSILIVPEGAFRRPRGVDPTWVLYQVSLNAQESWEAASTLLTTLNLNLDGADPDFLSRHEHGWEIIEPGAVKKKKSGWIAPVVAVTAVAAVVAIIAMSR